VVGGVEVHPYFREKAGICNWKPYWEGGMGKKHRDPFAKADPKGGRQGVENARRENKRPKTRKREGDGSRTVGEKKRLGRFYFLFFGDGKVAIPRGHAWGGHAKHKTGKMARSGLRSVLRQRTRKKGKKAGRTARQNVGDLCPTCSWGGERFRGHIYRRLAQVHETSRLEEIFGTDD